MAESANHLNEQEDIEPMTEKPFTEEKILQELVAERPELLPCEQMSPDDPRRWILIKQEQGIPGTEGGSIRWSLDLLLIDQDAIPTLVEVKRSSNSEIRRTIVGQILDYAAHAQHTLDMPDIKWEFEQSMNSAGQNPKDELTRLLQPEGEPDVDGFWQRVETNLREARLRLLFVADGIPEELVRVAEFLNEQMPNIEVLPVEIKQFVGPAVPTFVSRVVDRAAVVSARASGSPRIPRSSRPKSLDEILAQMSIPEVQAATRRLLDVARSHNAQFSRGANNVGIRARCPALGESQTVAWLYVPSVTGWMGSGGFVFGAGHGYRDTFENMPGNLRETLENWANQFSTDAYAVRSTFPTGHISWSISHEDAAANIDLLAERLENVLRRLQQLEPMQE